MKHFVLKLEEVNCGYETHDTVLFVADEGEEDEVAKAILFNWRGTGEWTDENEDTVDFGDGIEVCIYRQYEIPESEYNILKKHLSDVTFSADLDDDEDDD